MTPPIDIRADHLRIVQDVLHRHLPGGVRVWVFGSRANWMTKDSSDLDLALEGDTSIAEQHLFAMEAAFEDSDLPFAVDIVDVRRIGERFRRIVTEQRVQLPADRLHLAANHRRVLETLLREHLPGVAVWAYGSRVNGRSHDGSDLDLVLRGPGLEEIPIGQVGDFEEAVRESNIPFLVEARDWVRLPKRFQREIERDYVVLGTKVERSSTTDRRRKRLRDIAELVMGQSPPGSTYNGDGNGLPFFQGVKDFNYRHPSPRVFCSAPSRVARPGEILFSVRAPIGRVNIADLECAAGRGLAIIKPFVRSDTRYLEFCLRHMESSWNVLEDSGSVFGNATRKDLESLSLPWPPQSERCAIAHVLGTLDDKIERNRRMNETLEAMARALFQSWFVAFDPVRAKMQGRDTGLPPHLAALFPDRLVDSELGEIPEGWTVRALDSIAFFQNGLSLQKFSPSQHEERLPVVKISQLRAGETNSGEWARANINPKCIIENGDIVFSWSGSLLVRIWCGGRAALNQHLFKVTSNKYSKWFYLHSILSHFQEFQRIAKDKATTMGHIRRHHLTDALCVVPSDRLLVQISGLFGKLLERQVTNELTSHTLSALRDTLLPKLISGELRVHEAEKVVDTFA